MLVYLDTAHLDWIERLVFDGPPADARRFFGRWRDEGYQLAIAYPHVEEFAQLATDASINRRLAVLWEFRDVWYAQRGSGEVSLAEVQVQLRQLSGEPAPSYRWLRGILFDRVKPEVIARDLFEARDQLRRGRPIHETAAGLDNMNTLFAAAVHAAGITPRLSRNSPFTPTMARRLIEHVRNLPPLPPAVQTLDLFEGLEDIVTRAADERVSVREATERYHKLNGVAVMNVAPDMDLADLAVFFCMARQFAAEMDRLLGDCDGRFATLVPQVNPYDCPGSRLRLALLRARRSSSNYAKPGDMIDADHLAYAAHVDRAFVDKRTLHFLQQEARKRNSSLLPPTAIDHIRKSSSLKDLFPNS